MILNSHAKLNLYLQVLNKRKDKYHNLKTIFERISLCDKIILKVRQDKLIKISCSDPQVPEDETNLCFRSAKLLQQEFNCLKGIEIEIVKRIPVGAGLGGGSSNAATVLMGLNRLWKLKLSKKRLVELGKRIGCDVPFFIYDTPFALGTKRGDEIRPLPSLKGVRLWHLLVVPKIKVRTPLIYAKFDEYSGLTRKNCNVKIINLALRQKRLFRQDSLLYNSLEEVTARLYPEVRRIENKLASLGLKTVLMSGSGPAVFGIASSRKEAATIARQLKGKGRSWRIFLVSTF
ncbi:MAG TPA: 4-(cytidine 5'-diphospho)-2-C-methyl-D-erythritol kinase [Candidatus Margulisiibacteriota bacterium]|nr:4-(cytidine 5'-diphospho)-2-C-methyl-D-erythritol kinase [Candidatus Margulisiibacteriota bacterium]